ncbi:MAG: TerD family protein, partial [Actinomycetota bacterium]|nr:TerD family protein [Actinomycetota bacterium]
MKQFSRGQKSKLADLTPATDLTVGLDLQASGSPTFDISCFGVDAEGKLSDDRYFVFFNQKASPKDEVRQLGPRDGDAESFEVHLSNLPPKIQRLVFTATLDGAGTMSQVSRGHLRLLSNGSEVARFPFTGSDFSQEKAVIVGEIYRKDVWRFAAVG